MEHFLIATKLHTNRREQKHTSSAVVNSVRIVCAFFAVDLYIRFYTHAHAHTR